MSRKQPPWCSDGLRFGCTQCGHCCTVEGYVWVSRPEVERIARFLGMTPEAFSRRYVRRVKRRHSLIEKPNQECIFWDQGCSIYPVRPTQCRTFPFWKENLESPESWDEVASECPGIGQGRLYSREEIDAIERGRGEASAEGSA